MTKHRAAVACLLLIGCGMDVDQIEDVGDLRVLAIRADPPEVLIPTAELLDASDLSALEVDVSFSALVVDPRGGRIDLEWQFCPVESFEACRDFEQIRDQTPSYVDDLNTMRAISATETDVLPADQAENLDSTAAQQRAVWPFAASPFPVAAPETLTLYHAETNFFGAGAGSWPSAQLRVTGNNDTILTNKRFVLGLDDYSVFSEQLDDEFGFTVCSASETSADGCVELRPQPANTNPVFERLEIARSDQANAPFDAIPQRDDGFFEPPVLAPNEAIRLKPVFTAESFEPYQELQTNIDTQEIQVANRVEDISVAWFITAGEVQDALTWPAFTLTLDTVYTAPSGNSFLPNGRVSVWMVAQDQRGGTAWVQLELIVDTGL